MFKELINSRILVTGATGLIGTALCRELVRLGAHVIALVRNPEKAAIKLPREVEVCVGDVTRPLEYDASVDYIVHAASETASVAFIERPVEVIEDTLAGARNVLDFARRKQVKGLVFLSTMEVYGLTDSEDVKEMDYAALDSMSPRNCYPEAKRLVECLCASAAKEYGIPVRVARLTQTFGAGVTKGDKRVFAQFAEAAIAGRDIVLKSDGKTARCYCGIDDAVSAILTILTKGESGAAYNVANPETFCTIREMAELVAHEFSSGNSKVIVNLDGVDKCGYLPMFRMKLNVDRLKNLGWIPRQDLLTMFNGLIADWANVRNR